MRKSSEIDGEETGVNMEQNVQSVQGEQENNSEKYDEEQSEQEVVSNSVTMVQDVQVELRGRLESLSFVVTLDEGIDEPRIVGCNIEGVK